VKSSYLYAHAAVNLLIYSIGGDQTSDETSERFYFQYFIISIIVVIIIWKFIAYLLQKPNIFAL